jgi:hypothetical protein
LHVCVLLLQVAAAAAGAKVRVAVLGASGYTGEEVVRLLALHPTFKITTLTGDRQAGKVGPHLMQWPDRRPEWWPAGRRHSCEPLLLHLLLLWWLRQAHMRVLSTELYQHCLPACLPARMPACLTA